jgi:DNA-binding XRE family transcriptional regulator
MNIQDKETQSVAETVKKVTDSKVKEGNAFGKAVVDAKKAGKKTFKFNGKDYKVEEIEEQLSDDQKKILQGVIDGLKGAVKAHGGQYKELEKLMNDKLDEIEFDAVKKKLVGAGIKEYVGPALTPANQIAKKFGGKVKAINVKDEKGKKTKMFYAEDEDEDEIEESTAAYAKSLETIANDRKLKNISKKDKETLAKIADLLKRANEAIGKETVEEEIELEEKIEEIEEAVDPRRFVLGGDTKVTKKDVDKILSKIFLNNKLAKQAETSKAYKDGFGGKVKKNPYKKDTADFHLFILGQQSAQAS